MTGPSGSWNPSINGCNSKEPIERGYQPKVHTHFTNGYGEIVEVATLQQSAKDIIYVRKQHSQGGKALLTLDDVKTMQTSPRYIQLKAELSWRLNWSKPYDILK